MDKEKQKGSIKFPNCCAALTTAAELDIVICEDGKISYVNAYSKTIPIVITTSSCPFCDVFED